MTKLFTDGCAEPGLQDVGLSWMKPDELLAPGTGGNGVQPILPPQTEAALGIA